MLRIAWSVTWNLAIGIIWVTRLGRKTGHASRMAAGPAEIIGRALHRVPPRAPLSQLLDALPDRLRQELVTAIDEARLDQPGGVCEFSYRVVMPWNTTGDKIVPHNTAPPRTSKSKLKRLLRACRR